MAAPGGGGDGGARGDRSRSPDNPDGPATEPPKSRRRAGTVGAQPRSEAAALRDALPVSPQVFSISTATRSRQQSRGQRGTPAPSPSPTEVFAAAGAAGPGNVTPPSQAFSLDNSASPAANSSVEDIRVWAMAMFQHHEEIVKRIVEKQNADRQGVEGDVSALSARMEVIEVVVRNVNTAAVAADTKLREEIAEFSTKLAASEDHVKGVSNQFSEHVAGAFTAVSRELQQWQQQFSAAGAAPSSAGAAAGGDFMASVMTSQGTDILKTEEMVIALQSEHVKLSAVVAGLPCHCPHLDELTNITKLHDETLRKDHATLDEAAQRIKTAETAILQLQGSGGTIRMPPAGSPGPDLLPDAWAAAASRGTSAPAQAPPGIDRATRTSPPTRVYRLIENYEKLFDEKAAGSSVYEYSGVAKENGEKWRKTIRGYFISRSPVLAPILDYVEKKEMQPVTLEEMDAEGLVQGWMVEDFPRLSELLWGFLNTCLKLEAKDKFEVADDLDGFNAWRLVILSIRKSAHIRLAQNRRLVRNPPSCKRVEDIHEVIKNFDAAHKGYNDAGGTVHSDQAKKFDLLESMPSEVREQLQWRMKLPEPYEALRDFIYTTTDDILYHRRPGAGLNVLDEGRGGADKDERGNFTGKLLTPEKVEVFEEQMLASMKKMGFKTGARPAAGGGGVRASAGGGAGAAQAGRKCVNCGGLDHSSRECPKPELAKDKRPCWKCGIPGHLGRDCRKNPGAIKMVDDADDDGDAGAFVNIFGCVDELNDGWQTMGRNSKPVPSVPTFGDYLRASKVRKAEAVAATFLGSGLSGKQCTSHCCSREGKSESVTLVERDVTVNSDTVDRSSVAKSTLCQSVGHSECVFGGL